ncbi:hypothetical protein [Agrobacterium sp.]|uniref:hypothetical protein n=1 Tax=Agrobacterium sp. TaxID=361 RepID=UPI0028AD1FC4|nr:hypothetical protein [Agrobacterium sp.]
MLQTMLLTIVALPLVLGVVASLVARKASRTGWILVAALIPLFAAVVLVGLDGLPAFPPVRAAHKLPYVLLAGGLVFAILAPFVRSRSAALAGFGALISLAVPAWWMGSVILSNSGRKLTVTLILIAIAVVGTIWATLAKSRDTAEQQPVLPQAAFATALSTALVAIFGGYMGMAMFNGALTALFGGYLLVAYIAQLRGNQRAFNLGGLSGFAFAWVAFVGLLATAILAPQASSAALVIAGLTLTLLPLTSTFANRLKLAPALRPLICGLIVAVPAIIAILTAGLQFAG